MTRLSGPAQWWILRLDKKSSRRGARVGAGDMTVGALEPANINTGITIAGKRAKIPAGGHRAQLPDRPPARTTTTSRSPSRGTVSKDGVIDDTVR